MVNDKQSPYKVTDYGKVAVMMGGLSAEREISLESGRAILAALERKGVNAHTVDVQHDILQILLKGNFDRVFIALHGRGGEDGVIQGVLDTLQLPYTGSNVLGSALAMDKCRSKQLWQSHSLPTPAFVELDEHADWKEICDELDLPLMVKPVREGSSLGASKVTRADELQQAWQHASKFDRRVMAECWIEGAEYTVPILEERVLPLIRLETPREFYDYQAKYFEETTRYICPCGLTAKREREIGELAINAFKALGASGWGRIDLIIDKKDQPWLLEVNTIPGMTSHSLVPMAAKQAGMSFDDLVIQILNTSMADRE